MQVAVQSLFHVTPRLDTFFQTLWPGIVPYAMDFLHTQLSTVQKHLSFVTTDDINWKGYVQSFSWGVTLFETYLLFRQYPLYSKTEPPPVLASHFSPGTDTFKRSQKYGKDKATFSIVSGLYKQSIDSAMLQYGFYAWAWATAGSIIGKFGYGVEYEVSHALERFLF
jgi:STE24 endopeptidase